MLIILSKIFNIVEIVLDHNIIRAIKRRGSRPTGSSLWRNFPSKREDKAYAYL